MATSGIKWGVSGMRFMTKIDNLILEISGVQVQQQVSSKHVNALHLLPLYVDRPWATALKSNYLLLIFVCMLLIL